VPSVKCHSRGFNRESSLPFLDPQVGPEDDEELESVIQSVYALCNCFWFSVQAKNQFSSDVLCAVLPCD
jgi:hypothetical protein